METKQPITIEIIREMASQKGGKCLSEEFIKNQNKLKWQCKEGHIWDAPFNSIKSGSWCPVCNRIKRGWKMGPKYAKYETRN